MTTVRGWKWNEEFSIFEKNREGSVSIESRSIDLSSLPYGGRVETLIPDAISLRPDWKRSFPRLEINEDIEGTKLASSLE